MRDFEFSLSLRNRPGARHLLSFGAGALWGGGKAMFKSALQVTGSRSSKTLSLPVHCFAVRVQLGEASKLSSTALCRA